MSGGFHEVSFPLSVALGTTGGPERRTDIVLLSNGHESRNARWRDARRRYDAGSGMKSAEDLYTLIAFFEARQGSLNGFRFRDPIDASSTKYGATIGARDQKIGTGDGIKTRFQLVKYYGDETNKTKRVIEKPVENTIRVAVGNRQIDASGFTADYRTGIVAFATPPANGAIISAGYEFDVPVRFDINRLDINLSHFHAGHVPSIPLLEIKP